MLKYNIIKRTDSKYNLLFNANFFKKQFKFFTNRSSLEGPQHTGWSGSSVRFWFEIWKLKFWGVVRYRNKKWSRAIDHLEGGRTHQALSKVFGVSQCVISWL